MKFLALPRVFQGLLGTAAPEEGLAVNSPAEEEEEAAICANSYEEDSEMPSPRVHPRSEVIATSSAPKAGSSLRASPRKQGQSLPVPQDISRLSASPQTRSSSPKLEVKFRPRPICVNSPINIYTDTCYMHCRRKCPICFNKANASPTLTPVTPKQTVFIPDVRIVECDHVGPKFVRSKAYIRYPPKTVKDYEDIVEYDADSDDEEFLQSLNGDVKTTPKRKTANQKLKTVSSPVHIDQFEKIMDALEKAAYQQHLVVEKEIDSNTFLDSSLLQTSNECDVPCRICNDGSSDSNDLIVFCDGCNVSVHQSCYGVGQIPDGPWLCDWCRSVRGDRSWKIGKCSLCTEFGGALKETEAGDWCHVVCALWLPETAFKDTQTMKPIVGMERIDRRRWNMVCCVCGKKGGACVQCREGSCNKSFHVMCARRRGCFVEVEYGKFKRSRFVAYCKDHSLPRWVAKKRVEKEKEFMNKMRSKKLLQNTLVQRAARGLQHVHTRAVFEYWLKKREHYGHPLLRRIELLCAAQKPLPPARRKRTAKCSLPPTSDEVVTLRELRQKLERMRILLDLGWKRERLKRECLVAGLSLFDVYDELSCRDMLEWGEDREASDDEVIDEPQEESKEVEAMEVDDEPVGSRRTSPRSPSPALPKRLPKPTLPRSLLDTPKKGVSKSPSKGKSPGITSPAGKAKKPAASPLGKAANGTASPRHSNGVRSNGASANGRVSPRRAGHKRSREHIIEAPWRKHKRRRQIVK